MLQPRPAGEKLPEPRHGQQKRKWDHSWDRQGWDKQSWNRKQSWDRQGWKAPCRDWKVSPQLLALQLLLRARQQTCLRLESATRENRALITTAADGKLRGQA